MHRHLTPTALLTCLSFAAAAQTVITDADLIAGQTYNWSADQTYVLNGLVYLEAGARLNIEAGTVVKFRTDPDGGADADNTSALIITKGAQIFADGTASEPIIFTAEADDVDDGEDLQDPQFVRGQWGGLIILGNGTLASVGSVGQIEGVSASETRASYGGGATPNDTESSGRLRYVSIRHGGKSLTTDNEINGLTLGGVGSGTEIDYVEVFGNDDDGIEWFGGTVDVKHAVVAFCADDSYDYDLGWRGRGQFWFSLHGTDVAGRGGEHDGAIPDGQEPFANPTIANVTYIGSGADADMVDGEGNDYAIVLRDGGAMKYYNSLFTDFTGRFLDLEDLAAAQGVDSYQRLLNGDVDLAGNVFGEFGRGGTFGLDSLIRRYPAGDQPSGLAVVAELLDGNRFVGDQRVVAAISREQDGELDPRPSFQSALLDASLRAEIPTSAAGANGFFESTSYIGAFSNASGTWMDGWTALSFYNILTATSSSAPEAVVGGSLRLSPNPTQGLSKLSFDLNSSEQVSIAVLDVTGRVLSERSDYLEAGAQLTDIQTSDLGSGLYFVRVTIGDRSVTSRLVVSGR